jgi:hypothetical protein
MPLVTQYFGSEEDSRQSPVSVDSSMEIRMPISSWTWAMTGNQRVAFDSKYIQLLSEMLDSGKYLLCNTYTGRPYPLMTVTRKTQPACFPFPSFPLSSQAFRYASLALTAAYHYGRENSDVFIYAARSHQCITEAVEEAMDVDASSVMEVLTSSYALLLCCFAICEPLDIFLQYFQNIFVTASQLSNIRWNPGPHSHHFRTANSLLLSSLEMLRLMYLHYSPWLWKDVQRFQRVSSVTKIPLLWLCARSGTAWVGLGRVSPPLLLCRLCALAIGYSHYPSVKETHILIRYLFWAGIRLPLNVDHGGKTP